MKTITNPAILNDPDREAKDAYYLSLVMSLVNGARNNKKLYTDTRKEIKRLMMHNLDARDFFQKAFNSVNF